jgi:hypothetical protein
MAIEGLYLQLMHQAIGRLRERRPSPRALLLAYPDLLVPRAALARIVGEALVAGLPTRPDAAAIWQYHGLAGVQDPLFESVAFFRALGIEANVIDVARVRGNETLVDLNLPLPPEFARRYDLVVDTGTCEHCFNVGQAFMNSCEALAQGGVLMHAAPLTRVNHGFWNFSPTVYPDFFEANGFELQLLTGVTGDLANGMRTFGVDPVGRFDPPPNAALYVIAERKEVRELRWPVQRKYRGMIK